MTTERLAEDILITTELSLGNKQFVARLVVDKKTRTDFKLRIQGFKTYDITEEQAKDFKKKKLPDFIAEDLKKSIG